MIDRNEAKRKIEEILKKHHAPEDSVEEIATDLLDALFPLETSLEDKVLTTEGKILTELRQQRATRWLTSNEIADLIGLPWDKTYAKIAELVEDGIIEKTFPHYLQDPVYRLKQQA